MLLSNADFDLLEYDFRFKREEIRIQAWESQQKARLEAEMRQIEVKASFSPPCQ